MSQFNKTERKVDCLKLLFSPFFAKSQTFVIFLLQYSLHFSHFNLFLPFCVLKLCHTCMFVLSRLISPPLFTCILMRLMPPSFFSFLPFLSYTRHWQYVFRRKSIVFPFSCFWLLSWPGNNAASAFQNFLPSVWLFPD